MATIEVSESTYRAIELAASLTGMTPGAIVERLVSQNSVGQTKPPGKEVTDKTSDGQLPVYADYDGQRTYGSFDPLTKRIDITSGPLVGTHYKTPSAAARAVVAQARPTVNSNRNGWGFWVLDDGSGRFLQGVRRS